MGVNEKNKRKPKRSYSEADKAGVLALLDANGGNQTQTVRESGVPRSTLREWIAGEHVNGDVADKRQEKKEELGVLFDKVARLYLGRAMSADAVDETKGKDAVIAAATATDKVQLLKGSPTEITEAQVKIVRVPEKSATIEAWKHKSILDSEQPDHAN